jgi:hypothetical protein
MGTHFTTRDAKTAGSNKAAQEQLFLFDQLVSFIVYSTAHFPLKL